MRFPDVPTAKELCGPEGVVFGGGYGGISGPKTIPKPFFTKLHDAFKKVMEAQEYLKVAENFDLVISQRNSKEFTNWVKRTGKVVREFLREEGRE